VNQDSKGPPALPLNWNQASDAMGRPELFEGVVPRRALAYLIDVTLLVGVTVFLWLLVFATLGLLWGVAAVLTPVIPLAYHTLLIGGRDSATLGMRMMGIEIRRLDGGRPDLAQAFLLTALFYASIAVTSMLILVVALFNERGRCLHDWLSGTVTVNSGKLR